ncbi:MAG: hypothetical protein MUP45_01700 [Candidatus Marinimicrobia bacterium]|nr:hypothetical protein [Candidatus Neomarinimicrobiota bacterium]
MTLLFWWYVYFEWLQEWLWRKPKFIKILCSTGTPMVVGFAAYMFREQQLIGVVLGLTFAGPLVLIMGIILGCLAVEKVKGPARNKT